MLVEVAYASVEEQVILEVGIDEGATVETAIRKSGILEKFPELDMGSVTVGVFGHAEKMDRVLIARDRVEIYRPITCDPKEVRRQRARKKDWR